MQHVVNHCAPSHLFRFENTFGRRTDYNNERRLAKIQSATRRRLEGRGRSRITAATPVNSRPGSAASEANAGSGQLEEDSVRSDHVEFFNAM